MNKASQMAHTNKVRYYEKSRCIGKLFGFKTTTSNQTAHCRNLPLIGLL
ncbi:hypothetical protein F543_2400 [Bibersteinia trehalosi USDA-ARS-USMARC-189]|uniref:Uncharacterized protein n=2 Tax=Bibersteinia trehalosi TaxID=47735 RepID=W0RA39_BIBTR|nr:hypothetical protein F543_2400 [Bibersteinia trehalosi USDA-ARS-USMARC-189]AHG87307.1 hypothetical protein F544_20790 [Bibersteinia trehalosi USDA-ARS-USMARC-190]